MKWKYEKVILALIGGLFVGSFLFLLGVALGTSISGGGFRESLLPILNVTGTWISGIGALGAVIVALWLAEKQRRNDREEIKIEFEFVVVAGNSKEYLMISAVSVGNRPSELNSVTIYSEKASTRLYVSEFQKRSTELPVNLGYGKKATFLCVDGFENHLGQYLNSYCDGKADGLIICISSNTENFKYSPSDSMKKQLETIASTAGHMPNHAPS